jgi:hypothetical protein
MSESAGRGERAAASGYWNQYGVGAALIIDALREYDLEWIRVADPDAGRVDDLQIARTARLDAYQIKWEQYPETLTLNDITKATNPPLIGQLANGWNILREQHPTRRVVVHLVTDAYASTAALNSSLTGKLPEVSDPPTPYHFAAFIKQAWESARRTGKIDYEGEWSSVWRHLLETSELDEETFSSFTQDCELNLRRPPPPDDDDHRALADLLFEIAAGPERIVELKRSELLKRLGWKPRYEYRNRHVFDIPRFYRPIEPTVDELTERLDDLPSGYVAVIGPPGSGKSTLLTRTLRSLPVRLIRYYAYVPGAQDPNTRGESTNFLHDVTLRLDRAGFAHDKQRPEASDRQELLEKLHAQLQKLGEDYRKNGRTTVILVDGLDHIAREQQPERSLLKDLPRPDQIPEGVFFVLGSQTINLDNLSQAVRRELERSECRVEIGRLSPSDVDSIAAEVVPELDDEDRHQLFDLSAGHPLALIYLVKPLQMAEDEEARSWILSEAVSYDDDIDDYYRPHWEQVQDDEELVHVLGLLSRLRGPIHMEWVAQWIDRPVATKFRRLFERYFDVDAVDRWSFFHNSFRLFLQERTVEPVLGGSREEQERSFHAELAELYGTSDDPWRWETLYHLYRAENHSSVVEKATAEWFQEQVEALRPMEAVQADAKLAIRSAGVIEDPLALLRLTLVSAALEQQEFVLERYEFANRLLDLGDTPKALKHIRDGEALRVEDEHALRLSSRLAEMGMVREGSRVFELGEPYDLFTEKPLSDKPGETENFQERLKGWVEAAPRFESSDEVLSTIEKLQAESEDHSDRSAEEATANFRVWLVVHAVIACAERKAWTDWKKYVRWIDEFDQGGLFTAILRSAEASLHSEVERARNLLHELLERFNPIPLEDGSPNRIELRLDVADLVLFLEQDQETVTKWIEDLPPFPLTVSSMPDEDNISQGDRFRRYRLEYWLGKAQAPDELVERDLENTEWGRHTEPEKKDGLRRSALTVTTLAALWGRGKRGQRLPPSAFMRETKWILDLLRRPYANPPGLRLDRPKIVDYLVKATAEHGEDVLKTLADEFERRWKNGEWHISLRRDAAVSLANVGFEDRAHGYLLHVEDEMEGMGGPIDRAEEHWDQAEAWLDLEDTDRARVELQRMVTASRGLQGEEDHQSELWVRWIDRANELDPDNAKTRIRTMLRRLVAVSGEASGIRDAASEIIVATCHWCPTCAVYLVKGLQEKGVLTHERAFSSLLRATLEVPEPPVNAVLHALTNLVIPLTSPRTKGLVEALIESVASRYGKDEAITAAQYLVQRVRSEAIATDRETWLKRIEKGLEQIDVSLSRASINAVEFEGENYGNASSSSSEKLYLSDGSKLTLDEARQTVQSVSDFLELIEKEDTERTDFFRWGNVAEKAVGCADSIEDISVLKEAAVGKLNRQKAAKVLAQLSIQARRMREADKADALAEKALSLSEPEGWDRWWDGGSRLEAIQAIQEADPEKGRELAIQQYSEDITDSLLSFKRLLPHLGEIADLLFDEVPVLEIWDLIEDYLNKLYEPVPVGPVPKIEQDFPDSPTEASGRGSAADSVSVAITEYLDHLSFVVAARAVKASAEVLVSGSEAAEMRRALREVAGRNEASTERFLTVLEAVAEEEPDLLPPFKETLQRLEESPSLTIRARAAKLLSRLKGAPVKVAQVQHEIPSLYNTTSEV